MQALWLPELICDYIDKLSRRCIWAKGDNTRSWNLVSWDKITKPKEQGGIGLRSARANNIALLGRLVDDLIHEPQKPWVRALAEKYLQQTSVLAGKYHAGDFYIWRGIMLAKEKLVAGDGVH